MSRAAIGRLACPTAEPVPQPVDRTQPAVVGGTTRRRVLVTLKRDQAQVTLDDLVTRLAAGPAPRPAR